MRVVGERADARAAMLGKHAQSMREPVREGVGSGGMRRGMEGVGEGRRRGEEDGDVKARARAALLGG